MLIKSEKILLVHCSTQILKIIELNPYGACNHGLATYINSMFKVCNPLLDRSVIIPIKILC